jgi:hypothetical protein
LTVNNLYLLVISVNIRYNESDKQRARQGQGVGSTLPPDKEDQSFHANGEIIADALAILLYPAA